MIHTATRSLEEMLRHPRLIAGGADQAEGAGDAGGAGPQGSRAPDGEGGAQAGEQSSPGQGSRSAEELEADLARTRREAKARREENESLQKRLKAVEDRDKSEADKAREQAQEAERRAEAAEARAVDREIRFTIESVARDLRAVDPEAVVRFVREQIDPAKDGSIDRGEIEKAVKALLKKKPYLAPPGDAQENGNEPSPANPDRSRSAPEDGQVFGVSRLRQALRART